jgi:hypothetical protein
MAKKARLGRPKLTPEERGRVLSFQAPGDLVREIDRVSDLTGGTISGYLRDAVYRATYSQIHNGEGSPNYHYPERDKNEIPKITN